MPSCSTNSSALVTSFARSAGLGANMIAVFTLTGVDPAKTNTEIFVVVDEDNDRNGRSYNYVSEPTVLRIKK